MTGWFDNSGPLLLGHRGASAFAPENTMAAFELAIEQGAVGIEFDVQVTRDGIPVIIHDDTVDRTTDGTGSVTSMSFAETQALDAGDGQKIPTLAELLTTFQDRILYNLEIKNADQQDKGAERAILAELEKHELAANILISSFNEGALRRVKSMAGPKWPVAYLWVHTPSEQTRHALRAVADHPYHKIIDAEYMAWAKNAGLLVNTWTVDSPEDAERLVSLGVTGIITNRPIDMKL